MFVCFVCFWKFKIKKNMDKGLVPKSQLWTYGYLTGKKLGAHTQDYTLYKFLQLLLSVLQEKVIKVGIFIILEVTAVHVSHYFKVK